MTSAAKESLADQLRRANSSALLELVQTHGRTLTVGDFYRVLRHPFVTSEVLAEVAAIRQLTTKYEVRRGIARHRRTPETVALRFVSGLFWRDLLEMTVDVRLSPAVRQVAERYLIERLTRLSVGEKIALARRAPTGVLVHLRKDPNLPVIKALLQNPRLTEPILLPLAASDKTLSRVLDLLARDPRWGRRYEIRVALSRNAQAPFQALFEILPTLRREDLLAVLREKEHSSLVHNLAREILGMEPVVPAPFEAP